MASWKKAPAGSMLLEPHGAGELTSGVKILSSLALLLCLGACAGPPETLVVKQYQVRDQAHKNSEEPMLHMEKARRLHGAVSMEERSQRLGQYYTLLWQDPAGAGQGPVELVFQYQQGATASLVKQMRKTFPATAAKGLAEFAIIGEDYTKGGKVLTWKATLRRNGRELASRRSYLWQ